MRFVLICVAVSLAATLLSLAVATWAAMKVALPMSRTVALLMLLLPSIAGIGAVALVVRSARRRRHGRGSPLMQAELSR